MRIATYAIAVRYSGGTYTARCEGFRASCTSGPTDAALAVLSKVTRILGYPPYHPNLVQTDRDGTAKFTYKATPVELDPVGNHIAELSRRAAREGAIR
jgi:hypothetical protein